MTDLIFISYSVATSVRLHCTQGLAFSPLPRQVHSKTFPIQMLCNLTLLRVQHWCVIPLCEISSEEELEAQRGVNTEKRSFQTL